MGKVMVRIGVVLVFSVVLGWVGSTIVFEVIMSWDNEVKQIGAAVSGIFERKKVLLRIFDEEKWWEYRIVEEIGGGIVQAERWWVEGANRRRVERKTLPGKWRVIAVMREPAGIRVEMQRDNGEEVRLWFMGSGIKMEKER